MGGTASIFDLQATGRVTGTTFSQTVPSWVAVIGLTNQPSIQVQLGAHGSVTITCTVVVTTTLETGTSNAMVKFPVLTNTEAAQLALLCKL